MINRHIILSILCVANILGCRHQDPTNVTPINNSGKMVYGTIKIGQEEIPFSHLSNYTGIEKFDAGDIVVADLIDLWTGERILLRGTIPTQPNVDPDVTLLVEVNKNRELKISWLVAPGTFQDIHFRQFQSSFKCIPLVVANHGRRRGYLVRVKQGTSSYAFFHMDHDDRFNAFNYGFLQQGSDVANGLLCVSYVDTSTLETLCFKLSNDIQSNNPDISGLFLDIDQDQELAKLFLLKNTVTNPRELANDLKEGNLKLPSSFVEITPYKTDKKLRDDKFRLPDLSLFE